MGIYLCHFITKTTNNKCWQGCGAKGTLAHCWWECKLMQSLWKTIWRFLKKLKIETSLAVHWLRLHTSTAEGMSSIPGWGTEILHAEQCTPPKKCNKETTNRATIWGSNSTTGYICEKKMKILIQ